MNLPGLATRRRVTIGMVTLTFVLFGLIGLSDLKVNLLPDLSYPTLTVRTDYAGAAPSEIETLVSEPVEEAVGVVKNVRSVHSISRTGESDVILQFAWGTDMDMAALDVRDKLDTLQLPLEAAKPLLLRFNPSTDPIVRIGLTSKEAAGADSPDAAAALKRLRRFADNELKKRLEPVAGVAAVKVGGGLEDEIEVAVDQHKLAQLGIDIGTIIDRLKNENVNISGGSIDQGSQRYLVRTLNQFTDLQQMRDMLVKVDANGVPIRLKDVAQVWQGYKERDGVVRVDGHEAIELAAYKQGDANTVSVARAVRAELDKLDDSLPAASTLTVLDDQSVFIRDALSEVRNDALIGGVLAVLVIFFFLGHARSTFIVSLSLPVSLVTTFFFMDRFGLSLNVMSLGGLALATGMVVDDSIVVPEDIARKREAGMGIVPAAVAGASEVGMAVTASTLTTVAVFLPLVFVQGIAGQLFRDQALTVTFAMLISLVVAMTLIPMLASLQGRAPLAYREEFENDKPHGRLGVLPRALAWGGFGLFRLIGSVIGRALRFLAKGVMIPYERAAAFYHRALPRALAHPWRVFGFAAVMFAGASALVPTLGLDLIPQLAQDRFNVTASLPPGTPLARTDALVRELSRQHARDPGVASIYGVAGVGTRLDANPTESGENIARLTVTLADGADKDAERDEMQRLRAALARYPGVSAKFSRPELFSSSAPLEVELRGYDLDALTVAGRKLASLMQGSGDFTDVKSTVAGGYPQIDIRFDADRAAALGLTTRDIADRVVRKVKGEVATRYDFHDRKIDVLVRARQSDRDSVDAVRNLIVGYIPSNPSAKAAGTGNAAQVDGAANDGTAAAGLAGTGNAAGGNADASTGANGANGNALAEAPSPGLDTPVRLSSVADVVATEGPAEIHRIGQERVAIVSASPAHGDLGSAMKEVRALVDANPLAAGVTVHIGGQGEDLSDSVRSLLFALGLAIFMVYLVMASQFESLRHPFVIMFSVPLAMVGAVLALKLTGSTLSVVVFIGLIMLVGIVVKNAIILIDRVNQLREEGLARRDAICAAAESRLRPISMTTLATLLGFLPLAIGLGAGAEVRAPMAITVMGGLAVSTLLTLVVIPVVYDLLDRRPDAWYVARAERRHARIAGHRAETAAIAGEHV
ncbi:MAG: efflux RND transporter permease subunit [Proteobacteria bacterium]|nr:efflux RND transporter permease subunit [Pseudomonadota bacterium]